MTDSFWRRFSFVAGLSSIALLFAIIVLSTNIEVQDLDLWLHIATGRHLVTQHLIPNVPPVDFLSNSISGQPWINHEWLFQVLAYLIFHQWGPAGVIGMQVVVVSITFLFLFFIGYNPNRQMATTFMLLLVLMVYQARFTIRPDIFSLLFFSMYIFILSYSLNQRWALLALVIIQILWTNFHGFFFLGPFVIALALGSEWVKRHVKLPFEWNDASRLGDEEYRFLKWALLGVVLACFVNPFTWKGALYPFKVFLQIPTGHSKIFFENIQELQRPISWQTAFSLDEYPQYKLLILISFYSFIFNLRRIDLGVFTFWLFFLLFSISAKRNIVFFSMAAYLTFMMNTLHLKLEDVIPIKFIDEKFKHITGAIFKLGLAVWMVQFCTQLLDISYFDFDKFERKSEYGGISLRNYPDKAVDFLIANKVKGNFFNDFNAGAYMLGRLHPDIKVYIDGRTEVYGHEFFKRYRKMWAEGDKELLDEAIEKFHLIGALLNANKQEVPEKILQYFIHKKDWVVVYFDYDAVIFLKDVSENREVIDKYRIDLSKWQVKPFDIKRLGSVQVIPYQQSNRAYLLEAMGFDDAAIAEARDSLKVAPGYREPYKILGKIYGKRKDHQKAFENFRIATMVDPSDIESRHNMAYAYENLGDFENAIKQYEKIANAAPDQPKEFFFLARAYAKHKEFNKTLDTLKKAVTLMPGDVNDVLKIGDIVYEDKEYDTALKIYQLAVGPSYKNQAEVHNKLGLAYKAKGDNENAIHEFEKALEIEPKNEVVEKNLENVRKSIIAAPPEEGK